MQKSISRPDKRRFTKDNFETEVMNSDVPGARCVQWEQWLREYVRLKKMTGERLHDIRRKSPEGGRVKKLGKI